ncbi:HlyU family transcriptional regulator [Rhizobium oryziradicis]|uniref:Transcriptional activator HlyU n=1 Tax=Rhizobium oryziradicis TaxID=1867956 RepID=A0A1Q8ZP16_9HYPH|nr:HlyU family transcriptional regulator [Rhizobium oryziradicis]OLP43635.1 transcriptional activator HlyU [Rhizobium oryziradicis]
MAAFFKKLLSAFSGASSGSEEKQAQPSEPVLHGDCRIYVEPLREGNQLRLAGRIEKDVNGEILTRTFIRADLFTSKEDAQDCTLRKAKMIIDQNGPALFADGEKTRST